MKRFISLAMLVVMLISTSTGVYADKNTSEEVLDSLKEIDRKYEVENSDEYVELDLEKISKLDKEQQQKILKFLETHGSDAMMEAI